MGYIGREPAFGEYIIADSIASLQDGIETNFQITRDGSAVDLGAVNNILIFKDGASLVPVDEFLLGEDGTSIEFIEPPEVGEVIDIRILGNVFDTITVANNSITTNKYQNLSVTEDKLATGSVTTTKIGTGAVGSTNLASNSVSTSKVQDSSLTYSKLLSAAIANVSEALYGGASKLINAEVFKQTALTQNETAVVTTSGSYFDFEIPSGVKQIKVFFKNVSLSGADGIIIQMGTSGTPETTGYTSLSGDYSTPITFTTGFGIEVSGAVRNIIGYMVLDFESSDVWYGNGTFYRSDYLNVISSGYKSFSGEIDILRIKSTGTNTFDGGQINISYRY